MDLTQLRTFVAVAQERHLTRAAERLHISQPAASAHIRALEAEFQIRLFDRGNRGLELTEVGRRLVQKAEHVLDAALELSSLAGDIRGDVSGTMVLGTNTDPELSRIGPLIASLRGSYPLLDLRVEVRSSVVTLQGIRNGELMAGFVVGSSGGPGLAGLSLVGINFCIAGPAAWRDKIHAADWKALARLPWIITAPGTSNHEILKQFFAARECQPNHVVEVNNDLLIRTMVVEGVGIGLIREDRARQAEESGLMSLSPLGVGRTNLLFVYLQSRCDDPVLRALISSVQALWPDASTIGPGAMKAV